jgi:hypothetical protein
MWESIKSEAMLRFGDNEEKSRNIIFGIYFFWV